MTGFDLIMICTGGATVVAVIVAASLPLVEVLALPDAVPAVVAAVGEATGFLFFFCEVISNVLALFSKLMRLGLALINLPY